LVSAVEHSTAIIFFILVESYEFRSRRVTSEFLNTECRWLRHVIYYFTERLKDLRILKDYKPDSLNRSGIDAAFRAHMFGWMLKVQLYMGIPNEVLHLATTYVDRYIWRTVTGSGECQLLADAALWVAIKTSTAKIWIKPEYMCKMARYSFSKEQLICMEENLLNVLDFGVYCPTPYTYLEIFLDIGNDIPPYCTRLVKSACAYILDMGLVEYKLTQFPAFLRCLAAIYLIRLILRVNGHILQGGRLNPCEENFHEFSALPPLPDDLKVVTGYSEESDLPSVAFIYATLVQKAKEFLAPRSTYPTELLVRLDVIV
uniref:CYCLIN domain-containing protein n=1 Tax=Hydatigena taeniaeformis TaxID=6205 RepID=A0A0R3WSH7_HYDTA